MKAWFLNRKRARQDRFVALVFPHLRQLYRVAFRLTRNEQEAEDLVQDLLAGLLPRVTELEAVQSLGPWLAKVLYRRYVDLYRRRNVSPVDETLSIDSEEGGPLLDMAGAQAAGMSEIARLDLQRALERALRGIPESWRELVLLHDVEGYTAVEVAEILSLELGTVKSRLHRARRKLQQLLDDEFVPANAVLRAVATRAY